MGGFSILRFSVTVKKGLIEKKLQHLCEHFWSKLVNRSVWPWEFQG